MVCMYIRSINLLTCTQKTKFQLNLLGLGNTSPMKVR